jgi:hypothetical protein
MNTSELIAAIDAEIFRLQQARELLAGSRGTGVSKPGTMSAEARARISTAQKKRWAQQKRAAKR